MLARLVRQPLLHFVVLGAALFGLHAWIGVDDREPEPGAEVIVVSPARVDGLVAEFERAWRRPPTATELRGLIDDWVREEVMVREALALGLDRDDSVVRRRMQQKLRFLLEDTAALADPSDGELQAYLDAHPESFWIPARVDLEQVWIDVDRHADRARAEAAAEALLVKLREAGPEVELDGLGDPLLLGQRFLGRSVDELEQLFGPDFAELGRLATIDRWEGPVRSAYGLHLVRVRARVEPRTPTLDEVREAVVREWTAARVRELEQANYANLRSRYEVRIEDGDRW